MDLYNVERDNNNFRITTGHNADTPGSGNFVQEDIQLFRLLNAIKYFLFVYKEEYPDTLTSVKVTDAIDDLIEEVYLLYEADEEEKNLSDSMINGLTRLVTSLTGYIDGITSELLRRMNRGQD